MTPVVGAGALPVLPFVHRNGTSADALYQMRIDYGHALREAMNALTAMAPNQRDYYLDPSGERWKGAVAQADRRMAALRSLYDELVAEVEALIELS